MFGTPNLTAIETLEKYIEGTKHAIQVADDDIADAEASIRRLKTDRATMLTALASHELALKQLSDPLEDIDHTHMSELNDDE